jgi:cobalamin biosynthesis protein CbiD
MGRSRRRWEDNIKMDLKGVRCEGMDWIELVQDRDRWRACSKYLEGQAYGLIEL